MIRGRQHYLEGDVFFDPEDPIYRDHFPGKPVVPGSMIIHAFFEAIKTAGFKPDYLSVKNFKFKHFLKPGNYRYRLEFGKTKIICRLFGEQPDSLAEGTFLL
jgi:3-hydroxyacyl-[acyl-carrier-protein] dehydratase